MQETQHGNESKHILGQILSKTFEVAEDTPFEDLIKKCDDVSFSREEQLDRANNRLTRLLNSAANTDVKINH